MIKAALINHYPLSLSAADAREKVYRNFAYMLTKLGFHVEIFSISDKDSESKFLEYKQNEIKMPRPDFSSGFTMPRIMDFSMLAAFGFRPSVETMSKSNRMIEALDRYKPDVILITDTMFSKTLDRYRKRHKGNRAKIISYSDSLSIGTTLDYIDTFANTKTKAAVIRPLKKFLKGNYLAYQTQLYRLMIEVADAFITTDDFHKRQIIREFPNAKGKSFAIFPSYVLRSDIKKRKPVKKIRTLLFLGSYGYGPNADAIDYIKQRIAPKLPDKKFIISGKGCPNTTAGNIQFMDTSISASKLLDISDMCLSPLTGPNTGVKIKIFDYLSANRIVIGTKSSFIGYNAVDGVNALIEDNIDKYAGRIKELEKRPALLKSMQQNVHTALEGHYEKDAVNDWGRVLKFIKVLN